MHQMIISAVLVSDENASVVELEFPDSLGSFTGSSKREPGERNAPGVGADLALSRALMKAALYLEARAQDKLTVIEAIWPQQTPKPPSIDTGTIDAGRVAFPGHTQAIREKNQRALSWALAHADDEHPARKAEATRILKEVAG